MALTADDIAGVASQVQQEFSAKQPVNAAEAYMTGAARPTSAALAGIPVADQDAVENWLRANYWHAPITGDARIDSDPNRGRAWRGVDQLQRQLALAGYLTVAEWQHLKRYNLLGKPDRITRNALKEALADVDATGTSLEELLEMRGTGQPEPGTPTDPFVASAPTDVRATIKRAYQAELGRSPSRAELARFEAVWRGVERSKFEEAQQMTAQAEAGESVPDATQAPNLEGLVSEQIDASGEAVAHDARNAFEVFRQMVGG